jgi:hypothetical protein
MPRQDSYKYVEGKIIKDWSYRLDDALKLSREGKMMDFLPQYRMRFRGKFPTPNNHIVEILHTWRQHFTDLDVPFVVSIMDCGFCGKIGEKYKESALVLWKERRVFNNGNKAR